MPDTTTKKLFLIQKHLTLSNIQLGDQTTIDQVTGRVVFQYSFLALVKAIKKRLPKDVPMLQFVQVVEEESTKALLGYDALIHSGLERQENHPTPLLAEYDIVGYERGIPTFYRLQFNIDWEQKRVIGPDRKKLHPAPDGRVDYGLYVRGVKTALQHAVEPKSDIYDEVMASVPEEWRLYLSQKNLSAGQARALTHGLLRVETKHSPKAVGPPFVIAIIPRSGPARLTYCPD